MRAVDAICARTGLAREFFFSPTHDLATLNATAAAIAQGERVEVTTVGERRERVDSAAQPSAYDLVRRMDARELRAFRAWVLAWTDEGPDAS